MESWFLYSLIALVLWGLWGFFPKLTVSYISPPSALIYEVIGALLVGVIVLASLHWKVESNPFGMLFGVLTGMAGIAAALAFLYAMSRGKASIVVTMTALYPLVAILLSAIILREPITFRQAIGILLAIVAMVLLAE